MQNWSLDDHPTLVHFRKKMDTIPVKSNYFYHLFLTPPYAMPVKGKTAFDYLFYTIEPDKTTLISGNNPSMKLKLEDNKIITLSGFKKKFAIPIILTTYCTSMNGLCFNIHEIENDIFDISRPIHPLYLKVLECYDDSDKSKMFIERTFENVPAVINLYNAICNAIERMEITPENRRDLMQRLQVSIEQLAAEIFKCPDTEMLPVAGKQKLNYLVYNALTSKTHFHFIMAYSKEFAQQDIAARKNMYSYLSQSKADEKKMTEAATRYLSRIFSLKSPLAQIERVAQFFEAIVALLPGTEIAADDILPAICSAMICDQSFSTQVVSFFTYLQEIWPSSGFDERLTYILTTCSIAATHLSFPPQEKKDYPGSLAPSSSNEFTPQPEARKSSDQDTINMLEDLLANL